MIELMLKYAFEIAGVSLVRLNVFDVNISAKACYSRVGFVEESFTKDAFVFHDEAWGRCHMVFSKCKQDGEGGGVT